MRVHFKISAGVPAATWLSTCGHVEPTDVPIGTTRLCNQCPGAGCVQVVHAIREPDALNHRVTLTVWGERLHAGATLTLGGILTRSPMETCCSPALLASIQELGDLATSEITAHLTRGPAVDDSTLDIEDELEDDSEET